MARPRGLIETALGAVSTLGGFVATLLVQTLPWGLNNALDQAPKGSRVQHIIGKQLEQVRKRLKTIPIIANKYQLIIKGKEAFWEFMTWARSPGHWRAPIDWLPEKGPGQAWEPGARPDSQWFAEFKARHYWQRSLRRMPEHWTDLEFQQATNDYEEYACIIV